MPQATHLPASLQRLIFSLQKQQNLTPDIARQCVIEARINEEDLLPWMTFDHPVTHSYGRKLVYDGRFFEIMVMSWIPGDFSAIHDHGSTEWGAVQSFGKAKHITYKLKENMLQTKAKMWFNPQDVVAVDHDLIHQMGNPTDAFFLSLHVYGCPNPNGSITGNARIFDLFEENIQYTDGGVFFCLPEAEINRYSQGLKGDTTTTLRHHQLMKARIEHILNDSENGSYYWQLKSNLLDAKINLIKGKNMVA
jgi:predicted metal-dependent enzyme (double-stranded beta helix superfamily)